MKKGCIFKSMSKYSDLRIMKNVSFLILYPMTLMIHGQVFLNRVVVILRSYNNS